MSYDIDTHCSLVAAAACGTLTNGELVDCARRVLADDRIHLSMPSRVGIRYVDRLEVTNSGLEDMLDTVRRDGNPESEAEITVVTGAAGSLIARLPQALAEAENSASQYRNFATSGDAMAWLAVV